MIVRVLKSASRPGLQVKFVDVDLNVERQLGEIVPPDQNGLFTA